MNKIELENMTFAVMASISKALVDDFAQSADVSYTLHDWLTSWADDTIVFQIKQRIFGKQILHEVISYPADWKEAFKERWYPEWAKNKWPVRYTTKTFDVRELVPSLDIPFHKALINVEVWGGSDGQPRIDR